jgi:hypothetical protein
MTAAKAVTATFGPAFFTLTVDNPGNGSVTSLPAGITCGAVCSFKFAPNATVTLTATPAASKQFTGWSGACTNATGPCVVTMSDDQLVKANFSEPTPTVTSLTPTSGAPGTVVSIVGTNLGSLVGSIVFTGPGATTVQGQVTAWTPTSAKVIVPATAITGNVTVTTAGALDATPAKLFTILDPAITTLSPTSGAGGVLVTLTGSNLGDWGTVTFAGAPEAAQVTSWTNTAVKVVVPTLAVTGNLTLTRLDTRSASKLFTVPPPAITTLSPASGPVGAVVTITGTSFGTVDQLSGVTFNGTGGPLAAMLTAWSDTAVRAIVPVGAINGPLTLTRADGRFTTKPFTVAAPSITSLTPSSGTPGTAVTLAGTNLGTAAGTVTFTATGGGTVDAPVTSWSATTVKVSVPFGAVTGNLTLTTADGQIATKPFTVPTPTLTSFSPLSGAVGVTVTLNGANFGPYVGDVSFTSAGGLVPAPIVGWTTGIVKVLVPAGAITGDVTLTTADGRATSPKRFTVPNPAITGLTPSSAAVGVLVTLTGTAFGATEGQIQFNGVAEAAFVTAWTDTTVKVYVPAGAATGALTLTTYDGKSATRTFTAPTPALTSLTPSSGTPGTAVTLTGTALGAAIGTVSFTAAAGGTLDAPITAWSDTSVKVTVPAGAATGPLTLTTADGKPVTRTFSVPAATLTGIMPTGAAGGVPVTLTGTNLGALVGQVEFAGGALGTIVAWSPTTVKVLVPVEASSGALTLTTADGRTATKLFTVPNPAITSLAPTSGTVGLPVTLTGTGFGAYVGDVTFTGEAGEVFAPITAWSDTTVKVMVPPGAASGPLTLVTASTRSATKAFAVASPTLTSLSPTSGTPGTPVTFTGTNLGAFTGYVAFTGTDGLAFTDPTSWTNTTVKAVVPMEARTGPVTLYTADGKTVSKLFTVPAPTLSGFIPTSVAIGGSLTINGTNFGSTPGTVTFADGAGGAVDAPVTGWNALAVKVTIPAAAQSGPVTVTTAYGLAATKPYTFPSPTISGITPAAGSTPGVDITLNGAYFGTTPGTVTFAGGFDGTVGSWGNASVTVTVPALARPGALTLTTANGLTGTKLHTILTPSISNPLPIVVPATGGSLTLTGSNFGPAETPGTVTIGGVPATITSWATTSVQVVVPAGDPGDTTLVLTLSNGANQASKTLTRE